MKGSPPFECDHVRKQGWIPCLWGGTGRWGREGVHFAFSLTFLTCRQVHQPQSSRGECPERGHPHCRETFRVTLYTPSLKSGGESHSCQAQVTIGLFSKGPKREQERFVRKFQVSKL